MHPVFIEGEFHAVWRRPDGSLLDVTAKQDGEKQICFIPDRQIVWNERAVDNARLGLVSDWMLSRWIELNKEIFKINNQANGANFGEEFVWSDRAIKKLMEAGKLMELLKVKYGISAAGK
jgi:hypothetical protein